VKYLPEVVVDIAVLSSIAMTEVGGDKRQVRCPPVAFNVSCADERFGKRPKRDGLGCGWGVGGGATPLPPVRRTVEGEMPSGAAVA